MSDRRAQVVLSVGCLKLAHALPPSSLFHGSRSTPPPPPSSSNAATASLGPFHGLTICVTGLSKDARKQVQEATMWMGGRYSPDLHPQCTHLIVQSYSGRKYEHALKHGFRRGLYVITLAWFMNCFKQNERLDESLYCVKSLETIVPSIEEGSHVVRLSNGEHSCLPAVPQQQGKSLSLAVHSTSLSLHKDLVKQGLFSGMRFFIDLNSSNELQEKVMEAVAKEGASLVDHWFIGSEATYVVCEGSFMLKYLGFNLNLVTPLWVIKSVRERHLQRLVQVSADLARHVSILLDASHNCHVLEDASELHGKKFLAICGPGNEWKLHSQIREREEKVNAAKACVRRRRGLRMQPCHAITRSINPNILLQSISWSITEPPSAAQFYTNSSGGTFLGNGSENEAFEKTANLFNVRENRQYLQRLSGIPEDAIYTRSMSESEKKEVVLKAPFLTVLLPVDRFAEIGPSSRTFFSEKGFEREHLLELIWGFYQEYMTTGEVDVAMYSDSKHADKLRTVYADTKTVELGYVPIKRSEFLGSRKSFEGLKRYGRENTSQVYELCLGT